LEKYLFVLGGIKINSTHLKTLRTLSKMPKLTEEDIVRQFLKSHNTEVKVEASDICYGGFIINFDNLRFYITEKPITSLNRHWGRCSNLQKKANELFIALPLYIGEGTLSKEIHRILDSEDPYKQSNTWLLRNFSIETALAYFNKYFSKSKCLSPYKTIIFEAIEAFYLGYDHISIMSLFPVFEGGLRNLLVELADVEAHTVSSESFEKGLKKLLLRWGRQQTKDFDWYPGNGINLDVEVDFFTHLNPQCDVLNATRSFFTEVIYKPTNGKIESSFNRHLTVHLLNNNFNEPANFVRIFLALTHLTFAESIFNQDVPFFWEGVDSYDKDIARFIEQESDISFIMRRKSIKSFGLELY